jgi:hypothetical protein
MARRTHMHDPETLAQPAKARETVLALDQNPEVQALFRQADRVVALRQAREDGWSDGFALLAQAFILAGLPLRPTTERQVVHEIRRPEGKLTIVFGVVGKNSVLPYGNDVNVLHYLFDHLNPKAKEHFVAWNTASDYFRWWSLDPESHKNQRDLRKRWSRLANLVVQIVLETEDGSQKATRALFPAVHLPKSIDSRPGARNQRRLPGQQHGVWIDPELARKLASRRVPIPKKFFDAYPDDTIERRLAIYLALRTYGAKSESVIPWHDLRMMLGSTDRSGRMLRLRVREAVASLKLWWPELEAEPDKHGLRVRHCVPLLLDGSGRSPSTRTPTSGDAG